MFKFIKRSGSARNRLFFLTESVLIIFSVYLSVVVRFQLEAGQIWQYPSLFPKAVLVMIVYQLSLYYHDLNFSNISRFRGNLFLRRFRGNMFLKLTQAISVSSIVLFVVYYLFPALAIGRGILLIDMALLLVILLALRAMYLKGARAEGFGERVVILGTGRLARQIGQTLRRQPEMGYRVVGFLDESPANIGKTVISYEVIGVCEDLLDVVRKRKVQTIISALPEQRGKLPVDALLRCKLLGIKVADGISFYEQLRGRITLEELKPSWVIFSIEFHPPKPTLFLKRGLDVLFSLVGLIIAAPVCLVIAVLIKLDSPGPVLYLQERAGEQGMVFRLLKFRSMRRDAESLTGPIWARRNDDRVTRLGRWLRWMRLDELPQVINVLRGDMSLVGPRPERPGFVAGLMKENPYYVLRLSVKPGLTGWAQVKYRYGATTKEALEKLQYDLYYIKNLSLVFDLYIIFETVKTVIKGNGAR